MLDLPGVFIGFHEKLIQEVCEVVNNFLTRGDTYESFDQTNIPDGESHLLLVDELIICVKYESTSYKVIRLIELLCLLQETNQSLHCMRHLHAEGLFAHRGIEIELDTLQHDFVIGFLNA